MHRTNFHQPKNMNLTPTHEFMPDQPSESREPNHPKGKMILPTTNPNRLDVCGDAQECAWMQVELGKLKTENAALRKDKERMDWLQQHGHFGYVIGTQRADCWTVDLPLGEKTTLRAAIDAAMKEAK